jgi:hypothetical protein
VETWKFVTLFVVIWLPLWIYFETVTRAETAGGAEEEIDG